MYVCIYTCLQHEHVFEWAYIYVYICIYIYITYIKLLRVVVELHEYNYIYVVAAVSKWSFAAGAVRVLKRWSRFAASAAHAAKFHCCC